MFLVDWVAGLTELVQLLGDHAAAKPVQAAGQHSGTAMEPVLSAVQRLGTAVEQVKATYYFGYG